MHAGDEPDTLILGSDVAKRDGLLDVYASMAPSLASKHSLNSLASAVDRSDLEGFISICSGSIGSSLRCEDLKLFSLGVASYGFTTT